MTFNDPSTVRLRAVVSAALGRVDALLAAPPEAPSDVQPWTATAAVGGPDLDVANCADLMLLGHSLDADLANVGTCAPARLAHRIHELRRDRTGACHHDGERLLRSADGWKDWFARPLRLLAGPSPGCPVTVSDRLLTVRLPDTLRWQDFDAAFDARLRAAVLDRWAMSAEGFARCAAVGVPPRRLQRFTPYGGGKVRASPATEIYLFDPVTGPDRLVRVVEDVVLRHVLTAS